MATQASPLTCPRDATGGVGSNHLAHNRCHDGRADSLLGGFAVLECRVGVEAVEDRRVLPSLWFSSVDGPGGTGRGECEKVVG